MRLQHIGSSAVVVHAPQGEYRQAPPHDLYIRRKAYLWAGTAERLRGWSFTPEAVWMSMRVATWMDELEMPVGEPGQATHGLRSVRLSLGLKDIPTSPWLWVDIFKLSVLSRWSHHQSIRKHCMLRGSLWQALLICHFASDIIHNN